MRWDWLSSLKNRLAQPTRRVSELRLLHRTATTRLQRAVGRFESLESRLLLTLPSVDDPTVEHELVIDGREAHAIPTLPDIGFTPPVDTAPGAVAPYPLNETFTLHSRPGATKTIYLDFDGHVTTGTSWNVAYGTVVTPAYDTDGDPSSFSNIELETIQGIWERIVEDYSPFDVDITTEEPTDLGDLMRTGPNDQRWGVRVAFGGSSFDWLGAGAGGVAFLGSFNDSIDTPCYVFPAQLGNGQEKATAEAASHEVGHTLGLSHDGYPLDPYYPGQGNGPTGWAPIMGVGYYQPLVQWSRGEYAQANNQQDDLAIISTQNGFGYRPDLAGDTEQMAAQLTLNGIDVQEEGVIETTADVDVYHFKTGDGPVSFDIQPWHRSPNLDILAELRDASGNVLVSANPVGLLDAQISATLTEGDYYLAISGVGEGDPAVTGYSDYGSIGQFTVTGTITSPATLDVEVIGGNLVVTDTFDKDSDLTFAVQFGNVIISSQSIVLKALTGVTQISPMQVSVPLGSISGSAILNLAGGDDNVTLTTNTGLPNLSFVINSGLGVDSFMIDGSGVQSVISSVNYSRTALLDGQVNFVTSGPTPQYSYTGLERFVDTADAANRQITFSGGASAIDADAGPDLTDGLIAVASVGGTSVEFPSPTNTLSISTTSAGVSSAVTLSGFGSELDSELVIAGDADDQIMVGPGSLNTATNNLTLTAGTVSIDAPVGSGASSADIQLNADMLSINAAIQSIGTLRIQPLTAGTSVALGDSAAGTLHLMDAEMALLGKKFQAIQIGDPSAADGPVEITSGSFRVPVQITGSEIFVTGLDSGRNPLELTARSGNISSLRASLNPVFAYDAFGSSITLRTLDNAVGDIGSAIAPIYVSTNDLTTDSSASSGDQFVATEDPSATLTSASGGSITIGAGTFNAGTSTAVTSSIGLGTLANARFNLSGHDLSVAYLTGDGGVVSLGSQTLTINSSLDATFGGVISGLGNVIKAGSGAQTLSGMNTYSGTSLLTGGSLLIDGTLASSVSLAGGFLGGSGTVMADVSGSISGGGIAPGSSPGQLTVSNNVTLESSQFFDVEINGLTPGTEHDQLVLSGTASVLTLNSPVLAASVIGYAPTPGDKITLIDLVDPASTIVGTFRNLPEGAAVEIDGYAFTISYSDGTDGNDVVLTAIPAAVRVVALQPSVTEDSGGTLTFQFQRFGDLSNPLLINFSTSGLADATDYVLTGASSYDAMTGQGSIDLGSGMTTVDIQVTPNTDTAFEVDEDVTVTVLPGIDYEPGATISDSALILNDDVGISLAINQASVPEAGPGTLVYTFTRHASTTGSLTVNFALSNMNTAQLGTDYLLTGATTLAGNLGTAVFADGQTTFDLTVTPIDDPLFEIPETVTISVQPGAGYDPADPALPSAQTGLITSEDNAVPTLNPIGRQTVTEDDPQQTINLSGITAGFSDQQNLRVTAVSSRPDLVMNQSVVYTSPLTTGQVLYTPEPDAYGSLILTITVEDGGLDNDLLTTGDNLTFSRDVEVVIQPVNDDPTLAPISSQMVNEDSGEHSAPLTGMSPGPKEFEPFRVTAVSSDPTLIPFITIDHDPQSPTGTLRYRTGANLSGMATITVSITDAGADGTLTTESDNRTVTQTFDVTVDPINDPPTIDLLPAVVIDEDSGMLQIDLTGITGGPGEPERVDLSVRTLDTNGNPDQSVIPDPTILSFTPGDTSAVLQLAPNANAFGNAVIELTLTDFGPDDSFGTMADNATRVVTFSVSVRPVNDAPQSTSQTFMLPEASPADTLVGMITATDIDSDRLRYEILSGNTNNAFKIDTNSGALYVNDQGALNLETQPTYDLMVAITDLGTPPESVTIQVTVDLTDVAPEGALIINPSDWLSDSLIVRRSGAMFENIEILDGGGMVIATAPAVEVDSIIINGNNDVAESVLVDFSVASAFGNGDTVPPLGLTFNGGTGDVDDSLEVKARLSDVFTDVVHLLTGPDSATIRANDNVITLNGVEQVTDKLRASNRGINLTGADDQITLEAGPSAGDFLAELRSAGTTPMVVFGTPVAGMTLDLGDGTDSLTVSSFEIGLRGRLTVLGGDGDDSFFIGGLNGDTVTLDGGAGNDSLYEVRGSNLLIRDGLIAELNADVLRSLAVMSSVDFVDATGTDGPDRLDATGFTGNVSLTGLAGDDVLIGGLGNDLLDGGDDRDMLIGGPGNDSLLGGLHADTLSGNEGVDEIDGQGGADRLLEIASGTIVLTPTTLSINGEADVLHGIMSAFLYGEAGDDVIDASLFNGWVRLTGGAGDDVLTAGPFNDILDGQDGDDSLRGQSGDDLIYGGNGQDTALGENGDDEIHGGNDGDSIDGGAGNDFLIGEQGNDRLIGGLGVDRIFGGGGRDTISGNAGDDSLTGNGGFDVISEDISGPMEVTAVGLNGASVGSDEFASIEQVALFGSAGPDYVNATGYTGLLNVFAGAGDDTIIGGQGNDVLYGEDGRDRLEGLGGDDVLAGQGGDDLLIGGDGNDFLVGGDGNDLLDGGAGDDRLRGNSGDDSLRGGAGNDLLEGNSQADLLLGGSGNDTLAGGKGDDTLLGEAGIDSIDGERNRDTGTGGGNGSGASASDSLVSIEVIDDAFTVDFDALISAF
ncbi:hypothetical protein GC176_01630 [bacterium]|nr:hypothetical protein [bacterium]